MTKVCSQCGLPVKFMTIKGAVQTSKDPSTVVKEFSFWRHVKRKRGAKTFEGCKPPLEAIENE